MATLMYSRMSLKKPKMIKKYGKKLVPFNFEEWLNNKELNVVDKNGYSVDVCMCDNDDNVRAVVIINGKAYDAEKKGLPIFFEVDDPEEKPFREFEVSDDAKDLLRNLRSDPQKTLIDTMCWFIGLCGTFGHYSFFTDKLWKKVDGFKDADEAEILNAFVCWWARYKFGYLFYPVGCSWATDYPERYDAEDTEFFDSHIGKYWPVIKAYYEWCNNQR